MSIETDLKLLVAYYAQFNAVERKYTGTPDRNTLLKIDESLIRVLNKLLLADGPQEDKVRKNYKKLSLCFHPDKKESYSPEIVWLESVLSQGRNDGVCFKTLGFCFAKIITPQRFKDVKFADISNREDLKQWLVNLKENASTYTGRSLYDSLIGLLDQSTGYFDELGNIKPVGVRALFCLIPFVFISYGTIILAEELAAVYAVYFILLKGGQYLERSMPEDFKTLGKTFQDVSQIAATTTTTFLIRLFEMIFWSSRQFYVMSLQIGSSLMRPLLGAPPAAPAAEEFPSEPSAAANLCRDIIVASAELNTGYRFETPELKLIAAPLENYLQLNANQLLGQWRTGRQKRLQVEKLVFEIRAEDKLQIPVESKLISVEQKLAAFKQDKTVYNKRTSSAVDCAGEIITVLKLGTEPATVNGP